MLTYLEGLFTFFRPAFKRQAAFAWFIIVVIGFIIRQDTFGVSSIIRALALLPGTYPQLLHFFHSSAYSCFSILELWWKWLKIERIGEVLNGRLIFIGDHTKNVKDGRKIPSVITLHQDSETGSKPQFFRGHLWGSLCMVVKQAQKCLFLPLWAEIHPKDNKQESRTTRIINQAYAIACQFAQPIYLVLDAFFATGPVFLTARALNGFIHILTRAKKNIVAYEIPNTKRKKGKRGPNRKYGRKLKLVKLFDHPGTYCFQSVKTAIYNTTESVKYLILDLIWKPVAGQLRFILIESSYGRIILMTSDMNLTASHAIYIYCCRSKIETFFDVLKNLFGGLKYHFWSKYLKPSSRRPVKNQKNNPISSNPEKTQNTLRAIEKFVVIQIISIGIIRLFTIKFPKQMCKEADCWLRTPCGEIPSPFIVRLALINLIKTKLFTFAKNWIMQIILSKRKRHGFRGKDKMAA